jgi:7,8-dihydropterin-6-yl-methyl-4-(beta-D-ribofuranosyl)aminobenzene 5'-phosphate synthase
MITLRILYDNTSCAQNLKADWGFAALIQTHDRTILFDTGADGEILLYNMRQLGIDPGSISDLFISHCHFDHIGGLSHFFKCCRNQGAVP